MNEASRTLLEALLVGAVALGAGLVANAVHPDGLSLTRDHFRTATPPAVAALPITPPGPSAPVEPDVATEAVSERLRQKGLQVISHAEAVALFEDPAYVAGAYVFVDARGDDAYRSGHVPGAVQFDRYHLDRHLESVQAACAGALKVIVYCIGVNCEDSELAAQDLPALGVDPRAVHVYVGGWTAWSAAGLPAETGARGGGDG